MDEFRIKACNPDNEPEIAQLVSLFEESYGERFPFRGVYDREFWNRNAGSRLMSLLAVKKRQVLAHVAVRSESRDQSLLQICFPACRSEFTDQAVHAARAAWRTLSTVAERQNWRTLYFGMFSDVELMQRIGYEGFDLRTTAILPGYAPMINPRCSGNRPTTDRDARTHLALGARNLRASSDKGEIFVPERHRSMISFLRSADSHRASPPGDRGHVSADGRGIEEKYFKDWQAWHVFVRPSLVQDLPNKILSLQPGAGRAFVFLDARDPVCPQAADQLELRGFLFCGLLPQYAGTECLVYAQPDDYPVEASSFLCPVAKKLADYIAAQETSRLSRVVPNGRGQRERYVAAG